MSEKFADSGHRVMKQVRIHSHETALVTCFRALDNINTRLYAYNQ